MRLPKLPKLPKLATLLGGVCVALSTLNANWGAISGIPGVHVPAGLTTAVQLAGVLVAMYGHSLGNTPDLAPKEGLESGQEARQTIADNQAGERPQ